MADAELKPIKFDEDPNPSAEEADEQEAVDLLELLNAFREAIIHLNARVSMIEDFLTNFVNEVEKIGADEEPVETPKLHVVGEVAEDITS